MGKYFLIIISLLLSYFSVNAQEFYKVTADKLNVRETKDPTSKKIGFVPQDENVAVIDSSDKKYFKIKVTNGEGWVSKEYLQRVNNPLSKPAVTSVPAIELKAKKDYSTIIFISLVLVIMIVLLFLIIKFVSNKLFMAFSVVVVIAIAYFFYVGFVAKKTVSGKYVVLDSDAQYQSFDFKSNGLVLIQDSYVDSLGSTKYAIEGDIIKFKQQENTFILLIRDDSTLVGEGFTKGIFKKN